MECCIEYNYLRNVCRDNALTSSESESVCVVVNRSKLAELVDLVDNLVSYENRLVENVSTLYYSVTYSRDSVHAVDNLCSACCESLYQLHESLCVGRECAVLVENSAVSSLVVDMSVDTDTVAVTLCDNALIAHIDELILKGRASSINN